MKIAPFFDLVFPQLCLACQKNKWIKNTYFCVPCTEKLNHTHHLQNSKENEFTKRFYGRVPLKEAAALYWYAKSDIVERMIYNIKYQHQRHLADKLGKLLGIEITRSSTFKNIDFIVPIPLHPKKKHQRGFNQSELLAIALSSEINTKVNTTCLFKKEHTVSQTHKSRMKRLEDINDSFGLRNKEKIKDKNILLIDDVLTTGATLEAAGLLLLNANVKSISMLTIGIGRH